MDLSHLNLVHYDQRLLAASAVALAGSLWIVFLIARTVVRVGLFVLAFGVGFGLSVAIGEATGHPQPLWASVGEGIAFAWAWSLVRAKVARVVTGLALLAMAQAAGWFGFDKHQFERFDWKALQSKAEHALNPGPAQDEKKAPASDRKDGSSKQGHQKA